MRHFPRALHALIRRSNSVASATHVLAPAVVSAASTVSLAASTAAPSPGSRDLVVPRQILARQRWTEVRILPLDDLYCFLLDLLRDPVRLTVARAAVDDCPAALILDSRHQLPNPAIRSLQLLGLLSPHDIVPQG
jgi:hypothetical protein